TCSFETAVSTVSDLNGEEPVHLAMIGVAVGGDAPFSGAVDGLLISLAGQRDAHDFEPQAEGPRGPAGPPGPTGPQGPGGSGSSGGTGGHGGIGGDGGHGGAGGAGGVGGDGGSA